MQCAKCGAEKPEDELDFSDAGRVCASCVVDLELAEMEARKGGVAAPVGLAAVGTVATTCCTSRSVSSTSIQFGDGPAMGTMSYGPDIPRGILALLALMACGAAAWRVLFGAGSLPVRLVAGLVVAGLAVFDLGMLFWALPSVSHLTG